MSAPLKMIAERLFAAEAARTPIAPLPDLTEAEAYRIQEINTVRSLAAGRRLVGRKIGLTSPAVQAQLGVDQPDYGMLFADMALADGEAVEMSGLIQPKVEAEVALVLEKALPHPDCSIVDLLGATAYVLPALEIVDSRIENWAIRFGDTVADNASSARFVLGHQPVRIVDVDVAAVTMKMTRSDGEAVSGAGRMCLGNPLVAALWLARKMAVAGRPLDAGDVILTGALGRMIPARAGDRFETEIAGLGQISVAFQ